MDLGDLGDLGGSDHKSKMRLGGAEGGVGELIIREERLVEV